MPYSTGSIATTLMALPVVFLLAQHWLCAVTNYVPEPYLDEIFHIPQAQSYWAGLWHRWDPKITTPPGLYIYSILFYKPILLFKNIPELTIYSLRATNSCLVIVGFVLLFTLHVLKQKAEKTSPLDTAKQAHTALNIVFFPLLFFFSALYYTDLLSALSVVLVYCCYLNLQSNGKRYPFVVRMGIFLCGFSAMVVRQTNVFWTAVFLPGLQAVDCLKTQSNDMKIYDPLISDAGLLDYIWTAHSLLVAAPTAVPDLIFSLWPYLALLGSFASFVLFNGGVVLGDKDNHVASLHLTQMLYFWPCVVFFSWPVLIPVLATLNRRKLPQWQVALSILGVMFAAVHYNTVVHPFILADNRHYVFYVFKILLRHWLVRYAVVPVYFVCAWLVLAALGVVPDDGKSSPPSEGARKPGKEAFALVRRPQQPAKVSFVLVWLVATSLSLITAPLVEPRYFIIPWLIWRLNIPIEAANQSTESIRTGAGFMKTVLKFTVENRLWIELLWSGLINLTTCYIFLFKGFEWPQEPGMVQRFMWIYGILSWTYLLSGQLPNPQMATPHAGPHPLRQRGLSTRSRQMDRVKSRKH